MKNSKVLLLVAFTVLLTACLTYVVVTKYKQSAPWKIYTSTKYGFSINYPSWWKDLTIEEAVDSQDENEGTISFTVPAHEKDWDGSYVLLNIHVLPLTIKKVTEPANLKFIGESNRYEFYSQTYPDNLNININAEVAGAISTFRIDNFLVPIEKEEKYNNQKYTNDEYGFELKYPNTKGFNVYDVVESWYEKDKNTLRISFEPSDPKDLAARPFVIRIYQIGDWYAGKNEECLKDPDCQFFPGYVLGKNSTYVYTSDEINSISKSFKLLQ